MVAVDGVSASKCEFLCARMYKHTAHKNCLAVFERPTYGTHFLKSVDLRTLGYIFDISKNVARTLNVSSGLKACLNVYHKGGRFVSHSFVWVCST